MRDQEQLFFPQTSSVLLDVMFSVLVYHSSDLLSYTVLWSFHCFSLDFHVILSSSSLVPSFLWGDPLVFCSGSHFQTWILFEFTLCSCQNSCFSLIIVLLTAMWSPFIITGRFAFFQQSSSKLFFFPAHMTYCFFGLPSPKLFFSLCVTSTEACPFVAVNPLDCVLDLF